MCLLTRSREVGCTCNRRECFFLVHWEPGRSHRRLHKPRSADTAVRCISTWPVAAGAWLSRIVSALSWICNIIIGPIIFPYHRDITGSIVPEYWIEAILLLVPCSCRELLSSDRVGSISRFNKLLDLFSQSVHWSLNLTLSAYFFSLPTSVREPKFSQFNWIAFDECLSHSIIILERALFSRVIETDNCI